MLLVRPRFMSSAMAEHLRARLIRLSTPASKLEKLFPRIWQFAARARQKHIFTHDRASLSKVTLISRSCKEARRAIRELELDYYLVNVNANDFPRRFIGFVGIGKETLTTRYMKIPTTIPESEKKKDGACEKTWSQMKKDFRKIMQECKEEAGRKRKAIGKLLFAEKEVAN
ncbi:hypothetical protein N431DRAFT_454005 [Stipitochalara longipes BDJ]|nr:hypothetical protein N431DRAFT_454005 [Stipitochalara longipes BDJ]